MPKAIIFIAVGMLFVGVLPLPYGYYMLLRFVACGVFIWSAFITYGKNEEVLPWVFVILAIVFNPLIKIHFPKELWSVVDFCAGLFLLLVSKKVISNEQEPSLSDPLGLGKQINEVASENNYMKAHDINLRGDKAYNNRGRAYYLKGDLTQAISDYTKAIEINPRDAKAYGNRGFIYGKKGDYDRAITDCNKAIKINARLAVAYNNRGLAYYFKGNIKKACGDAKQACRLGNCGLLNSLQSKGNCK